MMTRAARFWEYVATPFVWLFVGALAGWELLTRLFYRVRRRMRPPRLRVDDDQDDGVEGWHD